MLKESDESGKSVGPLTSHPCVQLIRALRLGIAEVCKSMGYLAGIRVLPPRQLDSSDRNDANWSSSGMDGWLRLRDNAVLRNEANAWLQLLDSPFALSARAFIDEDIVAAALSDRSRAKGSPPRTEKAKRNALRSANRSDYTELTIIDRQTGTPVSHRDVGLGLSQILPVLVSAIGNSDRLLMIEQPEIHLHPGLQAQLGDVFIRSSLGDRNSGGKGNMFILETHSEHLILRIMRRIRDTTKGTLPKGIPPVHPNDVAVLFVEPSPSGCIVREMELNERGEFVKAWPGGFFEEGLNEIISLASQKI